MEELREQIAKLTNEKEELTDRVIKLKEERKMHLNMYSKFNTNYIEIPDDYIPITTIHYNYNNLIDVIDS